MKIPKARKEPSILTSTNTQPSLKNPPCLASHQSHLLQWMIQRQNPRRIHLFSEETPIAKMDNCMCPCRYTEA